MLGTWDSLVGIVVTVLFSVAAVAGRALTPRASAVAAVFGAVIVLLAGFGFLFLLAGFVAVGSLATRYRFEEKLQRHVQEGRAGERGVSNVLSHILVPAGIAVAAGMEWIPVAAAAVLFASALAFAAADTLASEFGVLTGKAVSILSFRPVAPGTNGGISSVGQLAAVGGSLGAAGVGAGLFRLFREPFGSLPVFLLAVGLAGFVACQVDSVLGAAFENRGWLTKGSTNLLAMLASVGVGAALCVAVGMPL